MQEKPENDPNNPDNFDDEFLDEFGDEFADELPADDPAAYDAMEAEAAATDEELAYLDEDFIDEDDWEDEDDEGAAPIAPGAGAQKPKKKGVGSDMSFNTKVIIGAVVVGVGVLAWQVVTKKPQMIQSFATALSMTGATDGPIFGENSTPPEPPAPVPTDTSEPMLESPGMTLGTDNTPPMPAPVTPTEDMSPEEQASAQTSDPLTPMPGAEESPAPRGPDDTPPAPVYSIDARTDDAPSNPAEDMLKTAMAAREQQQQESPQNTDQPSTPTNAFGEEIAPPPAPVDTPVAAPETPAPAIPAPATPAPVSAEMPAELNQKIDQIIAGFSQMNQRMDEINTNNNNQINALRDELKNDITAVRNEVKAAPAPSGDAAAGNVQTSQQIESVRKEMQDALSQIKEEIKNAPAPAASGTSSGVSEAQLSDMRKEMQNQFAEMRKEMKAEIEKTVSAAAPTQVVVPVPAAPKSEPKQQAEQKPAAQPQAAAPATPKKTASASRGGAWQLKAAKPGKAWVARAGSNNIQGVGVGDTLEGIGRVTAISFVGGRWVVQGSNGSIRQ